MNTLPRSVRYETRRKRDVRRGFPNLRLAPAPVQYSRAWDRDPALGVVAVAQVQPPAARVIDPHAEMVR